MYWRAFGRPQGTVNLEGVSGGRVDYWSDSRAGRGSNYMKFVDEMKERNKYYSVFVLTTYAAEDHYIPWLDRKPTPNEEATLGRIRDALDAVVALMGWKNKT